MTRVKILALTAALALAAALVSIAGLAGGARAQSSPIQHIVVLDLENHSWDNVFGFWCQTSPRCRTGDAMPASVTLSDGSVVTPAVDPDVVPQVDHSVHSQVVAIDHGKMDGWQNTVGGSCNAAHHYRCISGYQASQVPNLISLANSYAVNDRFFSLKDSPSWGGHLYAVAGTTDGFTGDNPGPLAGVMAGPGWGCDSSKVTGWAAGGPPQPSCIPDYSLGLPNGGAFEPTKAPYVPTIMDRLGAAGLTWKIYGPASPSDSGYIWATCPTFSECLNTSQRANLVEPTQFFTDAQAGTLPSFSLIAAGGANNAVLNSCHNGYSMTACDNFVGQVASAVQSSPQWSSTALIITMDDYGGFYDSQRPAINPDRTKQGIRLPFIVVSPLAKPTFTDSTHATFASILAFTEHNFGLSALGQNDASAYQLTKMFNLAAAPRQGPKPHMVTRPVPKGDHIQWWEAKQAT